MQQFMINFRVRDLDAVVAQLKRAGARWKSIRKDTRMDVSPCFTIQKKTPIQMWEPRSPPGAKTPSKE